jgi:hypothetical protein
MAAMDRRDSAPENEEEYAQRFGRVLHLAGGAAPRPLLLLGIPVLVAAIILIVSAL